MADIYTIRGMAVGAKSKIGLGNLRVEAWGKDSRIKNYVGSTMTESDGSFQIQINLAHLTQLYNEDFSDLFFKIYEEDILIKTTENEIIWNIKTQNMEFILEVEEEKLSAAQETYTFTGTVSHTTGSPLGGITVLLYEVFAGGRQLAGTATTNRDGVYYLQVSGFSLRLVQTPVFQLEVEDEQGKILSTSSLLTNVQSETEMSFVVDGELPADSTFARFKRSISPLMGGMQITNLKIADGQQGTAYLSLISGQPEKEIEKFVKAQEMAKEIDVTPEVVYALIDQGSDTLEKILSLSDESISRTLKKAAEERVIEEENINIEGISQKLNTAFVRKMTDEKISPLSKLLSKVIDEKEMVTVLSEYRTVQENEENYWDSLNSELGKDKTIAVKNIFSLNSITGQQFEMSKALIDQVGEGKTFQNVKSLAKVDLTGWKTLISEVSGAEEKLCVPEDISGEDEKERTANYAANISGVLRNTYPTVAFLGDLERDVQPDSPFSAIKKNLVGFLENNPDFDFRQRKSSKLNLDERTGNTVKKVERLFSITEDYSVIAKHLELGDDSAYSMAQMSSDRFVQKYKDAYGGIPQARIAHLKAKRISALANALVIGLSGHMEVSTSVTTTPSLDSIADADLRTMFGSLEQAEVEESQTVYSPAAYLVDILNFLENHADTDGKKAVFAELKRRRGDILNIDLTGENTFTLLPYVDLAIEQMENLLLSRVNGSLASLQVSNQTKATAKELAAGPEYHKPEAYKVLKKTVFPHSLPFHLPLEEIRTYYNHLGVKRADLMRTFKPVNPLVPQGNEPEDYNWAIEYLGLSPEEAGIITGQAKNTAVSSFTYRNLYGFNENNWVEVLSGHVDVFLKQSELSYIELLYLLDTRYINNAKTKPKITITSTGESKPDTHVLKELGLSGMQEADLRKIAKFIRLWRKLGWKTYELDRAISALKMTLGKKEDLVALAYAVRASEMLRLPLEKVLPFWADRIDSSTYTEFNNNPHTNVSSLFERLFLNKTAVAPFVQDFQKIADGYAQPAFRNFQEPLAAALQTDLDQILLLIETKAFEILPPSAKVTFSALAKLYSHVTLAKSLNLPISQYIIMYHLIGGNPFESPEQMCAFMDKYNQLKACGFTIKELNYLLRHQGQDEMEEALVKDDLKHFQDELRSKLKEITLDPEKPTDTAELDNIDNLRENLVLQLFSQRLNISLELADKMLSFGGRKSLKISVNSAVFLEGKKDLSLEILLMDKISIFVNKWSITEDELDFLLKYEHVFGFLNPVRLPVSKEDTADIDGFLNLVKIIKARDSMPLGAAFGLMELVAEETPSKESWIQKLTLSLKWGTAVADLLGDVGVLTGEGVLNASFPDDFRNSDFLPRVIDCISTVKSLGIPVSAITKSLNQNVDSVEAGAVKNAIKAKYNEEFWYTIARQLRDPLREKQRAALVAYLVARPDSSPNRCQIWKNANELYEYLLIDVEMKPITMTSRIRQAISSVQLFVDRVLMNLEHTNMNKASKPLTLSADQANEWNQWRKLYRVWEANRKVFLYPENWLEPELRDDKTPFFKELEDTLQQNDACEENVEDAFVDYLEKLGEVSHLEIKAMFHEGSSEYDVDTNADVWHVLGRTYGSPHQYYYRKRVSNKWTAWEKVDAAIEGDHIIMRVWRKRLFLFWVVFAEKQEKKAITMPKADNDMPAARHYLNIQLAWSEFRHNKWTAKKLAKESLNTEPIVEDEKKLKEMKEKLHLSSKEKSDRLNLLISVYEYATKDLTKTVINRTAIMDCVFNILFPSTLTWMFGTFTAADLLSSSNKYMMLCMLYPEKVKTFRKISNAIDGMQTKAEALSYLSTIFSQNDVNKVAKVEEITIYYKAENARYNDQEYTLTSPNAEPQLCDSKLLGFDFFPEKTHHENMLLVSDSSKNALQYTANRKPEDVTTKINKTILSKPGKYSLVIPRSTNYHFPQGDDSGPMSHAFFFQDSKNAFFVSHSEEWQTYGNINQGVYGYLADKFTFQTFYHAHVSEFIRQLGIKGIAGLLNRDMQSKDNTMDFDCSYSPVDSIMYTILRTIENSLRSKLSFPISASLFEGIIQSALSSQALFNAIEELIEGKRSPSYFANITAKHFQSSLSISIFGLSIDILKKCFNVTSYIREVESYIPSILSSKISSPNLATVIQPYPTDKVDFEPEGAYSQYNWELFFHIPLYMATKLSNNQQFEEARRWFHYIFDPTSGDGGGKERFWKFKPFYEETQKPIETMDDLLRKMNEILKQIDEWMDNPFNPHAVARMRILAYMKNVVMKYIDNLLAWADQLFRQDTIESINEATQLYILAAKILGDRPQRVPLRVKPKVQSYSTLSNKLDAFSNAMVAIETFIPPSGVLTDSKAPLGTMAYFLLDKNEKLLRYWDIVADRLFKIRHSMNIEGVERALALFEPPIDPMLLVRAAAAGLSLSDVLKDMTAPMPNYRFNFMLQKANELCGDVKALGSSLLAALEKKDAEQLALIRQSHETKVLEAMRFIKASQVKEAEQSLEALHKSKEAAELRLEYYSSRPFMNSSEQAHVEAVKGGLPMQIAQSSLETAASVIAVIPDFKIGVTTTIGTTVGGSNFSAAMRSASAAIGIAAAIKNVEGSLASIQGGFQRRADDWEFQADSAAKEIEQLEKQILASEIRLAITSRELANHDTQIENAHEINDFMTSKFTNRQLYDWMIGQLSTVYFQSYQLAYDLAKRAQRCYEYELGLTDAAFVQFGYWDGLKKGLLSGEKLQYDLRRMEASYLQENRRGLELQKHVSLAMTDPKALLALKREGWCEVEIPELLFDLDYPGHYFRRIKSVSVTIPCVTGPYVTVNCTLRLTRHRTRVEKAGNYDYLYKAPENDGKFRTEDTAEAIACSSAQNDSGMFELNFRDERYLPFEGCGADSVWRLELTEKKALRQFDYETISDVIFHIKYTAKEGIPKEKALACVESCLSTVVNTRVLNVRHEFPSQWHRFTQSTFVDGQKIVELPITKEMFPFLAKDKNLYMSEIMIVAKCKQKFSVDILPLLKSKKPIEMGAMSPPIHGWLAGSQPLDDRLLSDEPWKLSIVSEKAPEIEDIYLCVYYNLQ